MNSRSVRKWLCAGFSLALLAPAPSIADNALTCKGRTIGAYAEHWPSDQWPGPDFGPPVCQREISPGAYRITVERDFTTYAAFEFALWDADYRLKARIQCTAETGARPMECYHHGLAGPLRHSASGVTADVNLDVTVMASFAVGPDGAMVCYTWGGCFAYWVGQGTFSIEMA